MSLCPHGIRIEHQRCDRCEEVAAAENSAGMSELHEIKGMVLIPRERVTELLRELRTVREECHAQSGRIAKIVGELTESMRSQ